MGKGEKKRLFHLKLVLSELSAFLPPRSLDDGSCSVPGTRVWTQQFAPATGGRESLDSTRPAEPPQYSSVGRALVYRNLAGTVLFFSHCLPCG